MSLENLPRKINIGCGFDIRAGWLNVDGQAFHKPDMVMDFTDLSELPARHFDYLLAKDILEHVPRGVQVSTLKGWERLMAPGATLHIQVPSLFDLVQSARLNPEWSTLEAQHNAIQLLCGTQAYPGDWHFCHYTPVTLLDLASQAGIQLTRCEIRDGWMYAADFKRADETITDAEFVQQAYFQHLWRPADEAGLRYHLALLESGTPRDVIANSLKDAFSTDQQNGKR